jgi:hypothetical protein
MTEPLISQSLAIEAHKATVRIEADYSPHWSFACEVGEDCEFYNPAHDECNAVVWLENDDATNESLVAGFDAWTGPVKLKWNPDGDHVSGYYSFEVAALPVVSSPVTDDVFDFRPAI